MLHHKLEFENTKSRISHSFLMNVIQK